MFIDTRSEILRLDSDDSQNHMDSSCVGRKFRVFHSYAFPHLYLLWYLRTGAFNALKHDQVSFVVNSEGGPPHQVITRARWYYIIMSYQHMLNWYFFFNDLAAFPRFSSPLELRPRKLSTSVNSSFEKWYFFAASFVGRIRPRFSLLRICDQRCIDVNRVIKRVEKNSHAKWLH